MATAAFQSFLPSVVPFRVPRPFARALECVTGLDELERVYDELQCMNRSRPIAERLLDVLAVSYTTSESDLARVPGSGAAIVTLNHPFGLLEGAVVASLLGRIRRDVRILANGLLTVIPEVARMVIPVDPMSGRKAVVGNGNGLRAALRHLRKGGMLVVFPAGEVSHFRWKDGAVVDGEWNPAVAGLVRIARAPVIPAFVAGANGLFFQLAGMAHAGFRTALLGRELLNKRGRQVEVRLGSPIPPDKLMAIETAREQADYLRWRTYLLSSREAFKPRTSLPLARHRPSTRGEAIAAPMAPERLAAEIDGMPPHNLLNRSGDLEVYLARAKEIPCVLHELGRLREITFRAAGEGTGKPLDIDPFDAHYLHLFVWNARKQELVGAYRLAGTDEVCSRYGIQGLYTATLFRYGDPFLKRMGPALELGRSFIRQEYQKGFAPLLLLWKGIGTFIGRNPRYKVLFGPVSISNEYRAISRELMVSFLEKYALMKDWTGLVRNRQRVPERLLKGAHRPAFPGSGFDVEDLSAVVADLEDKPAGVPVLLRQYLKLGGKLLGFNVDPMFSNSLDGLILVDLTQTEPKLLERYLGRAEAQAFLDFQKGRYGTH